MFENPRRGRQARNFTTNVPKILDLKSSSEQIFSELGAPGQSLFTIDHFTVMGLVSWPLSEREAEVDLVLVQTCFLL